MRDGSKTKAQLIEELADLHQRVAELEAAETGGVGAEEALRKALLEKDAILNSLVELVTYQDMEMKILWANRAACESADLACEELIGRHCYEVWPQRSEPCPDCPVVGAAETGRAQEVERTTPDGRSWFIRGYPIRDEGGDAVGAVEVTLEITARKQAEEVMHRSLAKMTHSRRLLLALSQAAQAMQRARTPGAVYSAVGEHTLGLGFDATVFALSDDRTHLIVSYITLKSDLVRAAEKLIGLSAEGYRFPLMLDGKFQRVIAGGETVFGQLDVALVAEALPRLARPLAGRLVALFDWQQSIIAPLSVDGEVRGLLAVTGADLAESDVPAIMAFANHAATALENARLYRETQQLAAFSESIIQNMTEGIVVHDAEGRCTFANPAVAALLGYAPGELVGSHWSDIIPVDQRPIVEAAVERRLRGLADRYELEALRKDGRRVPILVSGTPHSDATGHSAGSMAVFTAIAELKQAAEALQESEDKMRSIFRVAPVGIGIIAPTGIGMVANRVLLEVNPRIYEMTGYAKEELIGNNARMLYPSQRDFDFVGKELFRQIEERGTGMVETRWQKKDGSIIDSLLAATPIDIDDPLRGVTFTALDITERKQAEEALRVEKERAQQYLDIAGVVLVILDGDGLVTQINRRGLELLGYQETELVGENWFRTCLPERLSEQVAAVHRQLMAGEAEPFGYHENPVLTRDGEERIVAWHNSILRDASGNIFGVLSSGVDVTERKRAEEERERLLAQIRAQATQIQHTIDTVPEGVLLLDAKGHVILANPVAEDDLAILTDARVGDILRPGSEEALTQLGDRPLAELLTSPPTKGLWHEVKADGQTFEVIASPMGPALRQTVDGRLLNGNAPEPENWVLVIRDVTQERESERRIQQHERLAAVGQLAAGIAHDFNNIMAVIVLYTQMGLRLPDIPAQLRDRLQTVDQQAKRATELIQQILDFSRRAVLERRPMDLTPFLKEIVKLLERTVPESITLGFTYGRDEYTVNADPTRMQQAIMNLVVNARDAMLPKGGGELAIELDRIQVARHQEPPLPEMEAGGWVRIAVTDTGGGIPPDVLPHIFEPFFTTKDGGKGTGLGLAQVHGIVGQHEGHIDVSTEAGTGTTFTIHLPALLADRQAVVERETTTHVRGQGETVLVVEDNADLRKALVATLEELNYRVLVAADGREALNLLGQDGTEIALVLSDLVMPAMGGAPLFHAMRQRGLTQPVVMLSGHPMEKELESLREQGLAGWMLKPPDMVKLSQLLARALREAAE